MFHVVTFFTDELSGENREHQTSRHSSWLSSILYNLLSASIRWCVCVCVCVGVCHRYKWRNILYINLCNHGKFNSLTEQLREHLFYYKNFGTALHI